MGLPPQICVSLLGVSCQTASTHFVSIDTHRINTNSGYEEILCSDQQTFRLMQIPLKGALDKYNIIPQLFPKKFGIFVFVPLVAFLPSQQLVDLHFVSLVFFYLVKERFILSKRWSLLVLYIIVFYPLWMLICTINNNNNNEICIAPFTKYARR